VRAARLAGSANGCLQDPAKEATWPPWRPKDASPNETPLRKASFDFRSDLTALRRPAAQRTACCSAGARGLTAPSVPPPTEQHPFIALPRCTRYQQFVSRAFVGRRAPTSVAPCFPLCLPC
jgi:hypothetical protein